MTQNHKPQTASYRQSTAQIKLHSTRYKISRLSEIIINATFTIEKCVPKKAMPLSASRKYAWMRQQETHKALAARFNPLPSIITYPPAICGH